MAYDRYDTRDAPRDERSRWSDDRHNERGQDRGRRDERGGQDERGFFERASDQVASWFGDEDAERRRREDQMRDRQRESGSGNRDYDRGYGRDWDRDRMSSGSSGGRDHDQDRYSNRERMGGGWEGGGRREREDDRYSSRGRDHDRDQEWRQNRGPFASGGSSERDYNPSWRSELFGGRGERGGGQDRQRGYGGRDEERGYGGREESRGYGGGGQDRGYGGSGGQDRGYGRGGGYRPMTGDYGRGSGHESEQFFAASGVGRGERGFGDWSRDDDGDTKWGRDQYRSTSRAGTSDWTDRSRHEDPQYSSWRQRHLSDLDRDYDDYRREHQSRFESDFAGWREKRQQKRGLLGQIQPHMEVVGDDEKHVGTVDKVAGDRIILTKSDPASGGMHHSISCSDIGRVEGDRVYLDCSAEQAKQNWRDEDRGRALFERDDQGEMGPRSLDRSFSGTYRR
jgi:hypothetical protein